MKQIIESISYPCPMRVDTPDAPIFGIAMKSYVVGLAVQFTNYDLSIVSAIAPTEGGGYAVTFEDGKILYLNDHPNMEVLYKFLEETTNGDIQDTPPTEGV